MSIRMRHTRSHTRNRRSHHALKGLRVVKNEDGTLRLPHRLDEATGTYNGMQIVTKREKKTPAKGGSASGGKVKGPRTDKPRKEHAHDKHEHAHENAAQTRPRGFFGRIMNARPKARSGAGGGGA